MTISTLVDLVVGRAQADGAVVVAFFGLARRHFLCCVDGVNSSFLGALCLPLCDPLSPGFRAGADASRVFYDRCGNCLDRRAVSRTVIGLQSEAPVLASVLLPASNWFRARLAPQASTRHTVIARRLAVCFRWAVHL